MLVTATTKQGEVFIFSNSVLLLACINQSCITVITNDFTIINATQLHRESSLQGH